MKSISNEPVLTIGIEHDVLYLWLYGYMVYGYIVLYCTAWQLTKGALTYTVRMIKV